MKFNSKSMDMTHGPLLKNILLFSIPLMLSNLLQIAFNAADTIVVGKFSGQLALAGVGACGAIINLIVSLFNGLSIGANIVIANLIGADRKESISDSVHTSYFLALAGGALLTLIGYFGSTWFLKLISTPSDIISISSTYMKIYFIGSIPLLIYDFGSAIQRSKGDTVRPTVYLTISGILNIFLNLFFVINLKMSAAGVAIATVISESVSAVLVTRDLMKETDETKLVLRKIKPEKQILKRILQIGIPAGFQNMMWAVSNVAIQGALNSFGSIAVAGNSAAQNIESFVYIGMASFSQAAITFTSQNAGAHDKKRILRILIITCILMFAVSLASSLIVVWQGRFFLKLYTNDNDVIDAGMYRMKYVVLWLFLNAVLDVPASSMRGMGHSTLPTIIMLIGIVVVRLVYIATVFQVQQTLSSLYFCFPLSWTITLVLQFICWLYIYHRF